ncbi:MAG: 4a-hydroxytetrahydrobiopterin dehydratase [Candidatus Hydrogenedentales bacterium]|jgi:4a-hydroxytetrahydrobiopterin dehydratase
MTKELSKKSCVPCRGGVPPLEGKEITGLLKLLGHDWQVVKNHHLEKEFEFKDFKEALAFTNAVGAIAEEENHHPDILTSYGKTTVTIFTHKIDGLTESDFVFAAKVEEAS